MKFTSQRQAARHFVKEYCAANDITFEGDLKEKLTKDDQANIVTMMAIAAAGGEIPVKSDKYSTQEDYEKYFKGQLNDALRKDRDLNGGIPYTAKNPGKFKNAGDPQIKVLKVLLKTKPEHADEIQEAIDKRQEELDRESAPELTEEQREVLAQIGLDHLIEE